MSEYQYKQADKTNDKWKQPNPTSGVPAAARKMLGDRYAKQYGENMMDGPMSAVNNLRADTMAIQNRTREEGYNRQGFNNVMQRSPWVAQQMGSMPADANAQQLHDAAIRAEHYGKTQAGAAQANAYQQKQMRDAAMMRQAQMQNYWATMQREQAARSRQQQQMASQQTTGTPVTRQVVQQPAQAAPQTQQPIQGAQSAPKSQERFFFPENGQFNPSVSHPHIEITPPSGRVTSTPFVYDDEANKQKRPLRYELEKFQEQYGSRPGEKPGITPEQWSAEDAKLRQRLSQIGGEAWDEAMARESAIPIKKMGPTAVSYKNPGKLEVQGGITAQDLIPTQSYDDFVADLRAGAGKNRTQVAAQNTPSLQNGSEATAPMVAPATESPDRYAAIEERLYNFAQDLENRGIHVTSKEGQAMLQQLKSDLEGVWPEWTQENWDTEINNMYRSNLEDDVANALLGYEVAGKQPTQEDLDALRQQMFGQYKPLGWWDDDIDRQYTEQMRELFPNLYPVNPVTENKPMQTVAEDRVVAFKPTDIQRAGYSASSTQQPTVPATGNPGGSTIAATGNAPGTGTVAGGAMGSGTVAGTNGAAAGGNNGGPAEGDLPPVPGMSEWFNSNLRPIGSIAAALLTGGLISMLGGDNKKNSALLTLLMLLGGGAAGMFAWNALGPGEEQTEET